MKVVFIIYYILFYGVNCLLLNLIDGLSKYDDVIFYLIFLLKGEVIKVLEFWNVFIVIFLIKEWILY